MKYINSDNFPLIVIASIIAFAGTLLLITSNQTPADQSASWITYNVHLEQGSYELRIGENNTLQIIEIKNALRGKLLIK